MRKIKHHIEFANYITWWMLLVIISLTEVNAQLSIGPGGWITVKEGGSMMIGTDLHIKSVAGSSGYFVDQTLGGDVTITGDILVERYMTADRWHNVASPVSNESTACFTGTDLVFWYDETQIWNDWNFGWVWYHGTTGGPLMVFRGYDVYFGTTPVTVNYEATGSETLNTGTYNYNVTLTDPAPNPTEIPSHKGWNLAGNPYPSPVDWLAGSGWDKSDINDYKYIWDGTLNFYTIFGGTPPIGLNGGTRLIPSNQGFWVQSVVPLGSLGINNAVRVGDISVTPDFYKIDPIDYPMVSLVASGNNFHDEIIIRFLDGTTEGFDLNKDAAKLFSFYPDVPQISIKSGKQSFALNSLPEIREDLAVYVDFRCGKPGNYKLSMTARTILDNDTRLYLKDEMVQKLINLKGDSSYMFYHDPSFPENRFKVWFNPSEDIINNISPDSYFLVYTERDRIIIVKNTILDIRGEIVVYNMLGQPVCREILENNDKSSISVNAPNGYYIVSIITNQHISNSKILIHN